MQVISRDIHRTFPEHPQFGFQQGQQALFRVLKAYSLHDLEVRCGAGCACVVCLQVVWRGAITVPPVSAVLPCMVLCRIKELERFWPIDRLVWRRSATARAWRL